MALVDTVVVGAGVVGLAISRALARRGRDVIVLEAANRIGSVTSARNSEVIHAGIYYPAGSLKAWSCVRGKELLYDYCRSHGVPFRRCGKLIVATKEEQVPTLESIRAKGAANGLDDLRVVGRDEARAIEPNVECFAALLSPSTGVVDSHSLMTAMRGDLEDAGGSIAFNAPLEGARASTARGGCKGRVNLHVGGSDPMELSCSLLVNSAGLAAPHVASLIDGLPPKKVPKAYFAKGNYFTLPGRSPFNALVYPVPEQAGLGVHATVDLGGQARFGPDVEWLEGLESAGGATVSELLTEGPQYDVDAGRAASFYAEVRRYWPGLPDGALLPDYSGIRPKIVAPGETAADFVVSGPEDHSVSGVVNLFGIESPGLTASLALAEHVERLLGYDA